MRGKAPQIHVLAGVNGAGKSSIGGAAIRAAGGAYYNPDEAAKHLRQRNPQLDQRTANGLAWQIGRDQLVRAVDARLDYAFETTLGANTIPDVLIRAATAGHAVNVWFVGLDFARGTHCASASARGAWRPRHPRGGHPPPL
jgi:predicted ABC-type ATPase